VTIVGIPFLLLIPFVLLGLWIVALVGFTAVAYRVGHLLSTRFGWHGQGPIAAALVGLLLLVSPVLLARLASLAGGVVYPMTFGLAALGFLVEYVAWTVGFGATALTWFNRRQEAASTR
jgi:hypothetical protein